MQIVKKAERCRLVRSGASVLCTSMWPVRNDIADRPPSKHSTQLHESIARRMRTVDGY